MVTVLAARPTFLRAWLIWPGRGQVVLMDKFTFGTFVCVGGQSIAMVLGCAECHLV